jgi:hypothetical protein
MNSAQLPDSIEIFRPGRHIDDAGNAHEFSPADVAGMAEVYNPAVREAPLTIGHPEHNRPAYGWVKGLAVSAEGRLQTAGLREVEPQFAEMVAARRFPKRSASFYPPNHPNNPTPGNWYLRHVAFLGAQPPAIAGLKDIQFADDAAGAISFSEAGAGTGATTEEDDEMDKDLQAKLDAAEKATAEANARAAAAVKEKAEADAKLAQFAEAARTERHAGYVSFCEEQVKAGKLLPKDAAAAVAVLDTLADAAPVEFAEAGATKKLAPADWLKGLIAAAKPVVSFGEQAAAGAGHATAPENDDELDKRAKAYAAQHNVSYADALSKVVSFTA